MRLDFEGFCRRTRLGTTLLAVAPHPDDETVGCGGLLALAARAGIAVHVVIVTDGAASHPNSREWPPERIRSLRSEEARQALALLGVAVPALHLGLPDAGTPSLAPARREAALNELAGAISTLAPDVIQTTWRREPHCDHRFAWDLTVAAMARAPARSRLAEHGLDTAVGTLAGLPRACGNATRRSRRGLRQADQAPGACCTREPASRRRD